MNALEQFLSSQRAVADERQTWGDLRLQVRAYLTGQLPPLDWITSVRAIVRRAAEIVVVRDPERHHIFPGGRRETGESLEQTLRREILEETGWEIGSPRLLGLMHVHHLTAQPANYPYPYPDFVQLIFVADALHYQAVAKETDGYELSAELMPRETVRNLPLRSSELAFLSALP